MLVRKMLKMIRAQKISSPFKQKSSHLATGVPEVLKVLCMHCVPIMLGDIINWLDINQFQQETSDVMTEKQ